MKVRFSACFFPAKIFQSQDPKLLVFGVSAVIKVEVLIKSRPSFFFEFLFSLMIKKIIERTKLLFPGSSVFILVSLISILFLVIALSQINLCQTSSMQESQGVKTNSSCRALATYKLQTSLLAGDATRQLNCE